MIQTIAGEKHMKILVYGAGVTGSFLCHALCGNGQDVELLGIREDEMKAWKKLKGQIPSWKKLHKT